MNKENRMVDYKQCEPVFGVNSKQWWVYANDIDAYIDVPIVVLNELKERDTGNPDRYDLNAQGDMLREILETDPDWLQDKDYWYDDAIDI